MSNVISFVPRGASADGNRVWELGPEERQIAVRRHGDGTPHLPGDEETERQSKAISGLADWQRNKIVRYVDENIGKSLRVSELAPLVRLSISRFSRGFKATFGQPPYAYVLSRRVEAAKDLISNTDEPLSQIAHGCGLCDQAHLCKLFKRFVGTTPLKWRQKSRPALNSSACANCSRAERCKSELSLADRG